MVLTLTVWAQVRKQSPNLERWSTWSLWISCLWPGHYCPGLGDLVQIDLIFHTGNKTDSNITTVTAEPAAWSVSTDKVKLVEAAEMNEGGASHTLFLIVLQTLATKNKNSKKATTVDRPAPYQHENRGVVRRAVGAETAEPPGATPCYQGWYVEGAGDQARLCQLIGMGFGRCSRSQQEISSFISALFKKQSFRNQSCSGCKKCIGETEGRLKAFPRDAARV